MSLCIRIFFLSFETSIINQHQSMKKLSFIALALIAFTACQSKKQQENTTDSTSVAKTADSLVVGDTLYIEDVIACKNWDGLVKKFGAENIKKEVNIETGEGTFKASKVFADTEKEIEVYWKNDNDYTSLQDVVVKARYDKEGLAHFNTPWVSRKGLKLGQRLSDVVALNGKTFTITGLGWDLGGNVVSWEGGKLADQQVNVRFNDFSQNMGGLTSDEYTQISGDREFDVAHPMMKKLNPQIDELSAYAKLEITPEEGHEMVKKVEEKQVPQNQKKK